MTVQDFSEDQYDLLRETVNVAMGMAGSGLADLLSAFVELSVPDVRIVRAEGIAAELSRGGHYSGGELLTAVRQTFYGDISGEAIVVFDETSPGSVSRLLGLAESDSRPEQLDLLLEMSNILIGACVMGIARHLFAHEATLDPPSVLSEKTDVRSMSYQVFQRSQLRWDSALVMKIRFGLEKEALRSDLMILVSEQSIDRVRKALDGLLARI